MATLRCGEDLKTVRAKAIVNAAGPWVGETLRRTLDVRSQAAVRLVKGSHIVTRKLYEGEQAYILQNPDKRIVFAIPFERAFTLIGTTDVPYDGEPGPVRISPEETRYLCESVSRFFKAPVAPDDIVWSYSGVRPLYDDAAMDASAVTRDYVLDIADEGGRLPVLSVFGGKITTYRRLSEHALEKLRTYLPALRAPSGSPAPWTADTPLPGGNMPNAEFDGYYAWFKDLYAFLPADLALRLVRAYGTRAETIIGDARNLDALGTDFGAGLYQREVDYLIGQEWAREVEDILWRRSKLGLHLPKKGVEQLETYLTRHAHH